MILVTGAPGISVRILIVELLNAGSAVTVFDNFSNSHPQTLARATHHGTIPSSDSGATFGIGRRWSRRFGRAGRRR